MNQQQQQQQKVNGSVQLSREIQNFRKVLDGGKLQPIAKRGARNTSSSIRFSNSSKNKSSPYTSKSQAFRKQKEPTVNERQARVAALEKYTKSQQKPKYKQSTHAQAKQAQAAQ